MNTLLSLTGHLQTFWEMTAFSHLGIGHIVMLLVGLALIFLAIRYEFQPLWLVPIGFGILIGNIPFDGFSFLAVSAPMLIPILVPIVFLGLGALIDFSALIANNLYGIEFRICKDYKNIV